jgi:hypothetical protein
MRYDLVSQDTQVDSSKTKAFLKGLDLKIILMPKSAERFMSAFQVCSLEAQSV